MDMIGAMRGAALPTQLIFSLSALVVHGYEPTAMRYFDLTPDGDIRYLTTADIDELAKVTDPGKLNNAFANASREEGPRVGDDQGRELFARRPRFRSRTTS